MRQPKSIYNARYRATAKGKKAQRLARAKYKQTQRARNIRSDYRINAEEREAMYHAQDGLCGLCARPMAYSESCLDHKHETGKRRALVHSRCNMFIGWIERFNELVPAALAYIERHSGN